MVEGHVNVKLPKQWTDDNAKLRGSRGETVEKRKDRKRGDAGAQKSRTVATYCVGSMRRGSGGSKSRLAKAAGAETSGDVLPRSRFSSQHV